MKFVSVIKKKSMLISIFNFRDRLLGQECQAADWSKHKTECGKPWYDKIKYRKCEDGNLHEGKLELITWPCEIEGTGWGSCLADESDAFVESLRKSMVVMKRNFTSTGRRDSDGHIFILLLFITLPNKIYHENCIPPGAYSPTRA